MYTCDVSSVAAPFVLSCSMVKHAENKPHMFCSDAYSTRQCYNCGAPLLPSSTRCILQSNASCHARILPFELPDHDLSQPLIVHRLLMRGGFVKQVGH